MIDRVSTASPNHFPANTANHGLTSHYTYDANGNLTADINKGITSITYNHLNKPIRITLSSGSWIEYRYDAAGTKVSKTTNTANKTDYLGGIEYDANALKRISFSEGYAELLPNATYEYKYAIKDHLGNTRSLFSQDATTLQRNHYYAFGLSITSLDFSGAGAAWKYQYNGKEKQTDFGLNWLDYGARQYDPVVARWHSVDPAAGSMRRHSPYNYCFDNPLRFIDPDGMVPDDITVDKKGNVVERVETDKPHRLFVKDGESKSELALNDPENDQKRLDNAKVGDKLVNFASDEDINLMTEQSGAYAHILGDGIPAGGAADIFDTFSFLALASRDAMDFGPSVIADAAGVSSNTSDRDAKATAAEASNQFVVFGNHETAFNLMDAGNFMWGQAASKTGISSTVAGFGAQVNEGGNDTIADQSAIQQGFNYKPATNRVSPAGSLFSRQVNFDRTGRSR